MQRTIRRILVANRGEIARRILRSAHAMGIGSVAVYADGDAAAPFVAEADTAIALGGRSSRDSYLDVGKLIAAARHGGADAVHPGYGFLSENHAFAAAVRDAGLTWIGPAPEAIAAMGDKLSSKRLATAAGVPTLPAVEVPAGADVVALAHGIGYPVLVKASAGGGGRGMRIVASPAELEAAVAGARREAAAAFGDDTVFLERWLGAARHVEIQVLGDVHGNVVHCFERECSIQRRHQKIVEEAPSPAVTPALRARMGAAAVAVARAVGYTSAGTVEFLLEGDAFWFLEMNTRLQVEHPVTEEITGLDLVREQIRIAQGEALGYAQDDLAIDGHAVEARVYAEDPAAGFLPVAGTVSLFERSRAAAARYESGVESGSEVGIDFDPMLAKVIVHAPTRREAVLRLARVLETTRVQGLATNRDFLVALLRHETFLAGDTTTDFIGRIDPPRTRVLPRARQVDAIVAAALFAQCERRARARVLARLPGGWRNSVMPPERVAYRVGGEALRLEYRARRDGSFAAAVGDELRVVTVRAWEGRDIVLDIDGRRDAFTVTRSGDAWHVHGPAGQVDLVELPRFPDVERGGPAGGLAAPMPGTVVATLVKAGDQVARGQVLLILEGMKMEHRITAPAAGTVAELRVRQGEQVANGALLVVLADAC
jgi:propionyl-CoA carboxylase alpha chain